MKARKESSAAVRCIVPVLFGTVAGLAVCLIVLLGMAVLLTVQDFSLTAAAYLAAAALALGAFAGGFAAARKAGGKGLLFGAASGFLLFAVPTIIGFSFFQQVQSTSLWFRCAIAVLCAAIGGVLGVNARRRR